MSRRSHSHPPEFMGVKVIISGSLHQLHKSSLSSYKSQAISAKLLTESFWLVGWLVGPTAFAVEPWGDSWGGGGLQAEIIVADILIRNQM